MSERWHAVLDADGNVVSIGTIVADPLPKGLSVVSGDVADGQVPTVVDGALVGIAPPEPEVVPSLEERLAAVEAVVRGEAPNLDAARTLRR